MIREYIIKISDEIMEEEIADRPQELVRCKDCKHGEQLFIDYISCQLSDENESGCYASHKSDWFCADGKRW